MQEVHKNEFGQLNLSYALGWKPHARTDSFNVKVGNKVIILKFPKCLNYLRFQWILNDSRHFATM